VYAALVGGSYRGGVLVMPQFRVAVDFRSQGVLLCDSHVLHGNTPMNSEEPFQRLAVIAYFSETVKRCFERRDKSRPTHTEPRRPASATAA
jgi:hypothetical protein